MHAAVSILFARHMIKRHRIRYRCEVCGQGFHKSFVLKVHLYNRHKVLDPSLTVCRKVILGYAVIFALSALRCGNKYFMTSTILLYLPLQF